MLPKGLYAIADADYTANVVDWGSALIAAGVGVLQLRAKSWSDEEILLAGSRLMERAAEGDTIFILNDHPHLAAQIGAHGVHLGQTDISPDVARDIVGEEALIGLSTHNLEQVHHVATAPGRLDYLGFGPVFHTASKEQAGAARGTAMLAEAVRQSVLPVVAIGGITPGALPAIREAGAHGWATISALCTQDGPSEAIRRLSVAP